MKKVKIYGTLGPSCADPETLRLMLQEGMDGIRLNLSHTTLGEASDLIDAYHNAAAACGVCPELLIDLQGPELRIGRLAAPIVLTDGETVSLDAIPFPVELRAVLEQCPCGQEILLDDGKLLLEKSSSPKASALQLRVIRGGRLESRKSVAAPGCVIPSPALTAQDREQLRAAKSYGVTGVMQPFVRGGEDLLALRQCMEQAGCGQLRLLAKVENMAGVEKLPELLPYCDEIVIARGDLGNSMNLWELPAVQKQIARRCREAGRDFMVVTQMLDSMIRNPVPTRAEVSDIFNAVLDGASSVMVTGETATGAHPVCTIRYLSKSVREAEAYLQASSRSVK